MAADIRKVPCYSFNANTTIKVYVAVSTRQTCPSCMHDIIYEYIISINTLDLLVDTSFGQEKRKMGKPNIL